MRALIRSVVGIVLISLAASLPARAAETLRGNLVDAAWLEANRGRADLLLLDASPAQTYAAQHIPGAVSVDVFSYGAQEATVAEMEKRLQSWGVSPGKTIVAYDAGGSYLATRLFFTLAYYGYPVKKVAVLDGGMSRWQAAGLPVSKEPVTPAAGSYRISGVDESLRVRLPEFLAATGDPSANAVVDALGPDWHYGQTAPFERAGHIPNSILFPAADFFNADKTFKSREELQKMAAFLDVRPEQQVLSYCGGGIAASVPFFALKYLLGYPRVELFVESQLGWVRDERDLPMWTWGAPHLLRDSAWVQAWNGRMLRMYGVSNINLIDIRPKEAFEQGHLPFALSVPADVFRANASSPENLVPALRAAGIDPMHEAVIISGAGLTGDAALAYALLEKLGLKKASILTSSLDAPGLTLTKEPTAIAPKKDGDDPSAACPGAHGAEGSKRAASLFPRVYVASGKSLPSTVPQGTVVHVPFADLMNADGVPKQAKEIWAVLASAGVPRYAELVTIADDPADEAAVYFILKLMGFADVKMRGALGS